MTGVEDAKTWVFSQQGSRILLILALVSLVLFGTGALLAGFTIVGPYLAMWRDMDASVPFALGVFFGFYSFLRAQPVPFVGGIAVIIFALLYKEEHLPSGSAAKVNLAFTAAGILLSVYFVVSTPLFLVLWTVRMGG